MVGLVGKKKICNFARRNGVEMVKVVVVGRLRLRC